MQEEDGIVEFDNPDDSIRPIDIKLKYNIINPRVREEFFEI